MGHVRFRSRWALRYLQQVLLGWGRAEENDYWTSVVALLLTGPEQRRME